MRDGATVMLRCCAALIGPRARRRAPPRVGRTARDRRATAGLLLAATEVNEWAWGTGVRAFHAGGVDAAQDSVTVCIPVRLEEMV